MRDKPLSLRIHPIWLIFASAFLLRVLFWIFLKNNYFFYGHPADDVLYYQQWAKEISRVNFVGAKTFFGLPLYPYFLAVLDRLTFGQETIIRLIHLALGSLNCVLIYILAKKIFSQQVALIAGLLAATNFSLIYYDFILLPVPLIITLSLLILLALSEINQIQTKREWFFLGILFGLTALGDGKMLIFSFLILLSFIFMPNLTLVRDNIPLPRWEGLGEGDETGYFTSLPHPHLTSPVEGEEFLCRTHVNLGVQRSRMTWLLLGLFLILGLTGLRNKIVGGSWVWITGQTGLSFYVGNHSQANGIFANPDFIRPTHEGQDIDQVIKAEILSGRELTDAEVSQFWFKEGVSFALNQPLDYFKLLGKKFILFFAQTEQALDIDLILLKEWRLKWDMNSFYLVCPLALLGMFLSRRRENTLFLNLLLLSQLLFTLIFFLYERQRVTILPILLIFEAFTLCWIIEQFQKKNFKTLIYAGTSIVIFLILFRPQALDSATFDFLRYAKAGPIYEQRKEYKKAEEQYFKALELQPNDANTLYNLANSFVLEGNLDEAEKYYLKVLALNPYETNALFNLGYVYEKKGDSDKARIFYQKVLKLEGAPAESSVGLTSQK